MEEENVKKHIHQIIGITDDERVLAECNLIEEILNKENKLSQYYKQQEIIDKAIEVLKLCNSKCSKEVIDILRGEDGDNNN